MFVSRISRLESLRNVTAHQPAGRRAGCASENPAGGAATTPGQSHQPRRLLPGRLMESQVIRSSRRVTSYYVNYSVVPAPSGGTSGCRPHLYTCCGRGGRAGPGPGRRPARRAAVVVQGRVLSADRGQNTVSSGLTRLTDGWRCPQTIDSGGRRRWENSSGSVQHPSEGLWRKLPVSVSHGPTGYDADFPLRTDMSEDLILHDKIDRATRRIFSSRDIPENIHVHVACRAKIIFASSHSSSAAKKQRSAVFAQQGLSTKTGSWNHGLVSRWKTCLSHCSVDTRTSLSGDSWKCPRVTGDCHILLMAEKG